MIYLANAVSNRLQLISIHSEIRLAMIRIDLIRSQTKLPWYEGTDLAPLVYVVEFDRALGWYSAFLLFQHYTLIKRC